MPEDYFYFTFICENQNCQNFWVKCTESKPSMPQMCGKCGR